MIAAQGKLYMAWLIVGCSLPCPQKHNKNYTGKSGAWEPMFLKSEQIDYIFLQIEGEKVICEESHESNS